MNKLKENSPLIFFFVFCLISISLSFPFSSSSSLKEIKGVEKAGVGELIVLEVEKADSYSWSVLKEGNTFNNYKEINNGSKIVFSAKEEGNYLFFCAVSKGGKVSLLTKKLKVEKESVSPLEPNLNDFEIMVKGWLPPDFNKKDALRLAHSFELIAVNSEEKEIISFVKLTALGNRAALGEELETWKPFLKSISSYCKKNLLDSSIEEHIQLWLHISAALRKVT